MKDQPTRMEQLGALLTAMVAVIVSGNAGVLLDVPIYSPHPELEGIDLREFQRGGKHFGIYAAVARDIGVNASSVGRVARRTRSKRIIAAILQKLRDLESTHVSQKAAPLTREELVQLRAPVYRGIYARVARDLQMDRRNVWRIARDAQSDRVVRSIRAEMDRVKEEHSRPLTVAERQQFARGGRYYGVYGTVGRELNRAPEWVGAVGRGHHYSTNILSAIRAEMARFDAEIAAKAGAQ